MFVRHLKIADNNPLKMETEGLRFSAVREWWADTGVFILITEMMGAFISIFPNQFKAQEG